MPLRAGIHVLPPVATCYLGAGIAGLFCYTVAAVYVRYHRAVAERMPADAEIWPEGSCCSPPENTFVGLSSALPVNRGTSRLDDHQDRPHAPLLAFFVIPGGHSVYGSRPSGNPLNNQPGVFRDLSKFSDRIAGIHRQFLWPG